MESQKGEIGLMEVGASTENPDEIMNTFNIESTP